MSTQAQSNGVVGAASAPQPFDGAGDNPDPTASTGYTTLSHSTLDFASSAAGGPGPTFDSLMSPNLFGNQQPAPFVPNHMLGHSVGQQADPTDKMAIRNHALFPLLMVLFEKCELATSTPRDGTQNPSNDICSSSSFVRDFEAFTKQIRENRPYYTPNQELDDMMVQAIQVLRFHLLELEKVHELCNNFCDRYINCLKGKMPVDLVSDDRTVDTSVGCSTPSAGDSAIGSPTRGLNTCEDYAAGLSLGVNHVSAPYEPLGSVPEVKHSPDQQHLASSTGGSTRRAECSTPRAVAPLALDDSYQAQAAPNVPPTTTPNTATGPLSISAASDGSAQSDLQATPTSHTIDPSSMHNLVPFDGGNDYCDVSVGSGDGDDEDDELRKGGAKKRGMFPKNATNILRAWLFQHLNVNNWFINARRRIVQPMIDQSNRAGRSPVVNMFKARRRKSSGQSPAQSPGPANYSPDTSALTAGYINNHGNHDFYARSAMLMASNPFTTLGAHHDPYATIGHNQLRGATAPFQFGSKHAMMMGMAHPNAAAAHQGAMSAAWPHSAESHLNLLQPDGTLI